MTVKALAYLRTSTRTNAGEGKDSETRQQIAIARYAAANGIEVEAEFTDVISGVDAVQDRPGFAAMLDRIEGNGVRLVLVEDASRFARDLLTQELGLTIMQQRGVSVVTASGDDLTATDDPTRIMMRQIAGAFAQYEKARLVSKLRSARERATAARGYRMASQYEATQPALVAALAALRQHRRDATLQQLADALNAQGFTTGKGTPLAPNQVRRLIERQGRG